MKIVKEYSVVNAVEAKHLIGREVLYADTIYTLRRRSEYRNILTMIFDDEDFPFLVNDSHWRFIAEIEEEEKPSYRLFKDTELEQLIGKIVKHRSGEIKTTITGIFSYCWLYLPGVGKISSAKLFDDYVFLDGSPCGVEVKVDG